MLTQFVSDFRYLAIFRPLDELLKLYIQFDLRNTFDGRPLRGCWAPCIDKKERKYSSVYKGLPIYVVWPN